MKISKSLQLAFLYLLLIVALYKLFQIKEVHDATLGLISTQACLNNNVLVECHQPFQDLNNATLINWDAKHYHQISKEFYTAKDGHLTAFFPLFPFIWKLLGSNAIAIIIFNFFAFVIGIRIIQHIFEKKYDTPSIQDYLLALGFPLLALMLIPYSEALTLVLIGGAFYFFMKDNYKYYFLCMLLAALNRSSIQIVGVSIVCAELFLMPFHGQWREALKRMLLSIAPIFSGLLLVTVYQSIMLGKWGLHFLTSQDNWDNKFRMPTEFSSWSIESFTLDYGIILFIIGPLTLFVLLFCVARAFQWKIPFSRKHVMLFTCIVYLMGTFTFVLFFRGGNLHNLTRFTLASPFFFVIFFGAKSYLFRFANKYLLVLFYLIIAILGLYFIQDHNIYNSVDFAHSGYLLLTVFCLLWLLSDVKQKIIYNILLGVYLFLNAVWTVYLIDLYMLNGWIWA